MATTGEKFCGTGANYNDGGTTAWSDATNIVGDTNTTAATVGLSVNGNTSQRLRGTNFGFDIPVGATINGVTVKVEASSGSNSRHYWNSVQLLKGGVESGENLSDGTAINSKAIKTFGGATVLWQNTLAPSDINALNFGASIKIIRNNNNATTTSVFRVIIEVDYTEAGTSLVVASSAHLLESDTPTLTETAPGLTTVYFQYRQVGDLEWVETIPQSVVESGDFSQEIAGLEPSTQYEYRAVVEWSGGISYGEIETFYTGGALDISSGSHTLTSEGLDLTQIHLLDITESSHEQVADNLTLSQDHSLEVEDSSHLNVVEEPHLSGEHFIGITNAGHWVTSENLELAQSHLLSTNDSVHEIDSGNVNLTEHQTLGVNDTEHIVQSNNVDLNQKHSIIISDTAHPHTAENVSLSTAGVLGVQDTAHTHTAENLILTQSHTLEINDSLHGLVSDEVNLVEAQSLLVNDSAHIVESERLELTQNYLLRTDDTEHLHTAENLSLSTVEILGVQDSSHAVTSEDASLVQAQLISINNASHEVESNNIGLILEKELVVDDANHTVESENLVLTSRGAAITNLNPEQHFVYDPEFSKRMGISLISTWNIAGRPSGKEGMVGYNFETNAIEVYSGGEWRITNT
jgi:hypothetical protein